MSKKGLCKYCHLDGHLIDDCPTIICKNCREVGHPNWLCQKKNTTAPISPKKKKDNPMYGFESTNSIKSNHSSSMLKKNSYNDFKGDFKTKSVLEEKEIKTIINVQYYNKIMNAKWGDLV
jgi:hypothetical protein